MATRRALVLVNGTPAELPQADTLAGVSSGVAGQGETHAIGGAPTGNGTVYSTMVTLTPGMTAAALQSAIRASGGDKTNVNVTGSSTAAVAGTATATTNDAGTVSARDTYTQNTQSSAIRYVGANFPNEISFNNAALRWEMFGVTSTPPTLLYTNPAPNTSFPTTGWVLAGGASPAPTFALSPGSGTPASANFAISGFPAGTNVTDIGANLGNGWTGTVTQQGGNLDAAQIGSGAVSNAEFGYLDGVTGAIQAQINTNAAAIARFGVYDIAGGAVGKTTASAVVGYLEAVRAFRIPENFALSRARVLANATSISTFSVKKNGTEIGTIQFSSSSAAGVFSTLAVTSFAAGDILTVVAPATADATLSDLSFVIAGVLV